MAHYYAVAVHDGTVGTCRTDIDDARLDIIDELAKGFKVALDRNSIGALEQIGSAIERAASLDSSDGYDGFEIISDVRVDHRTWYIKQNWSCGCGNQESRGGSW